MCRAMTEWLAFRTFRTAQTRLVLPLWVLQQLLVGAGFSLSVRLDSVSLFFKQLTTKEPLLSFGCVNNCFFFMFNNAYIFYTSAFTFSEGNLKQQIMFPLSFACVVIRWLWSGYVRSRLITKAPPWQYYHLSPVCTEYLYKYVKPLHVSFS